MRGNAKELIAAARSHGRAVPALNVDSIDMAMGVIAAAESARISFILQVTVETLDIWGWQFLTRALLTLIDDAHIPVVLLLDHAKQVGFVRRAIDMGFGAMMYDGSALPISENLARTHEVVTYARKHSTFVEGELGHVPRDGEPVEWDHLTTIKEAATYWSAAGVDALAIAIGTRHGHYRMPEDIHVERVREIASATGAPLVLHGGSGMPEVLFSALIKAGIAKVNVGTELRRAWWAGIDASKGAKPREALLAVRNTITTRVLEVIGLLASRC